MDLRESPLTACGSASGGRTVLKHRAPSGSSAEERPDPERATAPDARGTIRASASHDPRLLLEGKNRTSVRSRSRVVPGLGSLSRVDGDPHRAHLAQDPLIRGKENPTGVQDTAELRGAGLVDTASLHLLSCAFYPLVIGLFVLLVCFWAESTQ